MKPLFWFNVLKGVLSAVLVTFTLLGFFAFIGLKADDPSKYTFVYSNVSLFTGAILGGIIASGNTEKWLASALISGVCCAVSVLVPSLLFSSWKPESLLRLVLTVALSVIAAVVAHRRTDGGRSGKRESEKRRRAIAKKYSGM